MTKEEAEAKAEEWLIKTPLYERIVGNDSEDCYFAIRALALRLKPFDTYCVECRDRATFTPELDENARQFSDRMPEQLVQQYCLRQDQFTVTAGCARNRNHRMKFVFLHQVETGVEKIGQYPSLADLSIPETSQFVKVLGQDRVRELNKAIGLAAHGVGAGSYIYLRRIFESLVEEAHVAARQDAQWDETGDGWNEDAYQQLRVGERVTMLKKHLPAFLVEHPQLYGILSKHIHELSEGECLQNFDAIKEAILIIARDKLKAREEQEQRERASKLVQQIGSTMKR